MQYEQLQGQQIQIRNLPKRPQRSTDIKNISRPIDLVSNHFQIQFKNAHEIIAVYSIKIQPEIASDARQLKDQIMDAARTAIEGEGLKPFEVRGLNIWSPILIERPIIVQSLLPEANQAYTIKLDFTSKFSNENISGDAQQKNPIVQSLNVRIKNVLREKGLFEIGRTSKYYDPASIDKNKIEGHGLKVWRGYKTALHVFGAQPYLLIDFSSRVLRSETALQFMSSAREKYRDNESVREAMIGLSVIASYGNYRIYRVDDVVFGETPRATFDTSDGKITYIEYYKKRYNININNSQQPLLLSKDKRNPDKITFLIPELMNMTGLTDTQRKDWQLMKDVAYYTKLTPEQRNSDIIKLRDLLAPGLDKKGITLSQDQRLQGLQIDPPDIQLGRRSLKNDVGFFILKDPVLNPGHIKDWFLMYQSRGQRDDADADFLVEQLQRNAATLGIKLEKPYFIVNKDTNPRAWVDELDSEIKKGGMPQMVVSFIPEREKDRLYGPLKEFCLHKIGIHHQNVLLKFLKNKNPGSVASKIIQQMNVKIGCPIWSVPRPKNVSEKTMLIGIDIYHKLVKGNQSCMGLVASLDSDFTQYFSRVILMKKGSEMSTEIAGVIEQAIKAYFIHNGKKYLPDNVIIYRDGVGEGQIQALLQTELTQVEAAFKRVNQLYSPKYALIMINKKINHRFFSVSGGDSGGSRAQSSRGAKGGPRNTLVNPPTGTIVADKITSNYFDFFLCAQYVTEGTCTPTHYSVLANTTDWNEETFWVLTYYQCFNYMNWSGAVRVPACVQYAHKLAYLVGDTFQKQLNQKMETFLCYL